MADTTFDFSPVETHDDVEDTLKQASLADKLGYERVWLPENWGRNSIALLTAIAERTNRIGVGTSIVNTFSRTPALLGQTAITMQELTPRKFRLGIGPSSPLLIERWHGVDYDRPLRRMREYVEIIKAVGTGEVVDYEGEYFDLSTFRYRNDPPMEPPAVDVTAMGPKSTELAGRFADGWHCLMHTPEGVAERAIDLERGAELGSRDPNQIRTMLLLNCCALEDGDRARSLVRDRITFYLGGMGTYYRDALARQGYKELANSIHEAWQNNDRDRASALVEENILDSLAAGGTPEQVRPTVEKFAAVDEIDTINITVPREATPNEVEKTIQALAPLIDGN
jgi:coenzyme F420-dependent oxidoreductase